MAGEPPVGATHFVATGVGVVATAIDPLAGVGVLAAELLVMAGIAIAPHVDA